MRFLALLGILFVALEAVAQTSAAKLWTELKVKREALPHLHQEFEVSQTYKTTHGNQSFVRQVVLDMSHGKWREKSDTGSSNHIKIFNGKDLFWMEESGNEFVRIKRHDKAEDPGPSAYSFNDPDWRKAVERERRPCGIPGSDHQCVLLEVPLKPWTRNSAAGNTQMVEGSARILLDSETGLLLSLRTVQSIAGPRDGYQSDVSYVLKRLKYGTPADESLYKLPGDLREVKELTSWNAARIKKQLAGKPAPELTVTDIQGKSVALSSFKGKTVLLDFWTTWCPPCRADAPALDKLYRKYGGRGPMSCYHSVIWGARDD